MAASSKTPRPFRGPPSFLGEGHYRTHASPANFMTTPTAPKIERIKPLTARAGLLGIGHHIYWPQFDGLLDEMGRKQRHAKTLIAAHGVEVHDFGMLDTAQAAYDAVPKIKAADIDILFVDMVTYGTSSTFGILCRELEVPIVLLAIQPLAAMDYPNGTTFMQLCNDDFCSVPEFTGVAVRFGRRPPPVVLGHETGDPRVEREIAAWCGIAKALHSLRKGRIGLMGHVLESMLDMHTDPTAITAAFGPHIVLVEPGDIHKHFRAPNPEAVGRWKKTDPGIFRHPGPPIRSPDRKTHREGSRYCGAGGGRPRAPHRREASRRVRLLL